MIRNRLLLFSLILIIFVKGANGDDQAVKIKQGGDQSLSEISFPEAGEKLSLSKVLSLVLLKNPELEAFSIELRRRDALVLQAGLFPNPEIQGEWENFGGSGDLRKSENLETTIGVSQLVELGGKRGKRKRVASLEKELSEWDYRSKRLDILSDASKAFIKVISSQRRLELAKEKKRLAEETYATVDARVQAGAASPVQKIRANVVLASTKVELERTKRELIPARKELASFWGSASPVFQKAAGNFEFIREIPLKKTLEEKASKNPKIARWKTERKHRDASLMLEKSSAMPDLTMGAAVRHVNGTGDNAMVALLSLPLPFFNRNQGNIRAAKEERRKAKNIEASEKNRVRTELSAAYQSLSASYIEVKALQEEILPDATRAFEATREGYRQGKFSYLDVLDGQRTLFDTKKQYLEALTGYHLAYIEVEQLTASSLKKLSAYFKENTKEKDHDE